MDFGGFECRPDKKNELAELKRSPQAHCMIGIRLFMTVRCDKPVSYQITHIKKYGTPPKSRVPLDHYFLHFNFHHVAEYKRHFAVLIDFHVLNHEPPQLFIKLCNGKVDAEGYIGSSLLLKNKIVLRHYFSVEVPDAVKKGDYWYVEQAFNLTELNKSIDNYGNYNIYDYIKKVLIGDYDAKLKNLCCALYYYNYFALELGK